MTNTLVVNPGAFSRKYALYVKDRVRLEYRFEKTNNGFEMCSQEYGKQQICTKIDQKDFAESFAWVGEELDRYLFRESFGKLDKLVVRVVAPGTYFQHHAEITEEYLAKLKEQEALAPLHIPTILKELQAAKKTFPQAKLIAASDSAFHHEMPLKAREYSISRDDAYMYDIHRFGYHGLSVASVVRRLHPIIGIDPEKLVVCHIGGGVSVTAVEKGQSVETSMGFSPTSGLPMSSRAGDVDAGALLRIMKAKHWRPADAEMYLNTNGGLVGWTDDYDIRRLLDQRSQGEKIATQGLEAFAYHIQKAIASATVALKGLDVLVLTATASVRSSELRSLVLSNLKHLGVEVSEDRNESLVGKEGVISVRNSPVKVVVMKTDEIGEMYNVAASFKGNSQ